MSRGLACFTNPQPGGTRDFWSRFYFSSACNASIKLQLSSATFGPSRVFYFPGTRHIWRAFPYSPPGEAPDVTLATLHRDVRLPSINSALKQSSGIYLTILPACTTLAQMRSPTATFSVLQPII